MAELPDSQKAHPATTILNSAFAEEAARLLPALSTWSRHPQRAIKFEKDSSSYFGLKPVLTQHVRELETSLWGRGDEFTLDFGIHMVGHLRFQLSATGINIDAPCRLRLTFGESPIDVTESMDDVKTWISTSWLPDEVINVDIMPQMICLPRRYSFRYLRVQVIDTSAKFKVAFSDVVCTATSSVAPAQELEAVKYSDPLLQAIDDVSTFTLRDCMQTVFEDGPRRDRRLWLGDLRLQALVNYSTFRNYDLVKRSLYMFAALPREDRSLPACVFEKPTLSAASDYIVDYDILFGAVVHDYVVASNDLGTGHDLWDTIQGSLQIGLQHLDSNSVFDATHSDKWKFLDWADGLDYSAGMHGVLLYTLKAVDKLAHMLSKPPLYQATIAAMTSAASSFIRSDPTRIISGPDSQVSLASVAWLTLSGALPTSVAQECLLYALSSPTAVQPLTPYLWHHVAEALAHASLYSECVDLIKSYWGGMVRAGADTFWECFDPNDPRRSPYGDVRNNSFCHAWSCTPSWLLRREEGGLRKFVGARSEGKVEMRILDERWIERTCGARSGA